ncbi:hypothetical protein [Carnobacterium maltaromaticum]|uniref:hypothetical protein n=1 Tax=Carnobacterium maltaromaticum TaxID=2751 RepID=UPI00055941DA|nr:hypothetical protein [Carnobacterium maltaromaticum]KRN62657.1 hypothetical protein IV70_GL003537 [Carnobacterium maltaromaticum DSM 20342]
MKKTKKGPLVIAIFFLLALYSGIFLSYRKGNLNQAIADSTWVYQTSEGTNYSGTYQVNNYSRGIIIKTKKGLLELSIMDEYKENKGFVGAIKMVNEEEYTSVDFYKENSQNK